MDSPHAGASSKPASEREPLDLERDLPTTVDDIRVLRELRRATPGWLDLPAEAIEALLPADALHRRPPTPVNRPPFSLE